MDDFTKKRIIKIMDNYTKNKVPKHIQNQIRLSYKIRGNNITLIEERPAFRSDQWVQLEIAQFRLDQNKWKIYWRDSKKKWHFVDDILPDESFEKQLDQVENDNMGIFWG
ncbi:Protein of unknown function [Paenibacillus uliginis N3/975]|uniref:DUF3024 domain-containing protein n=1 Tax=Paenibacillus uliginis N3/975 TaxID=1313296 RepID=A0A1X7HDR4_9BACL|nr:DUF3024 domain-containing protein [Paenibacillus uliginis]SMF84543.1 Protein of unknown function [Paenibacillus uliginis N3/975]